MNLRKLTTLVFIGVAIVSLAFIQSCSNNGSTDNTARVQLKLVDAPGDYLEVNIEIIDIQYNSSDSEDGWMSFTSESGYPINVDLTELIAGNSLLLTDQIIPSGMLKQIRLVLSDNNTLKIEGEDGLIQLDTPSAQQSGLKLNLNAELESGFTYTFILDWNVQESVVQAGNSGMYNLKPVIKVTAEVNSGSISGKVIEIIEEVETAIENVTVMAYTTNDVLVTNSLTDIDGNFLIQGLEVGSYIIKIARDGYQDYESSEIVVTVGNVVDAGTIELILE
ncbi:DUF4382 domain-containing protein [Flavobacteriaceae bacterium AH-315-B10]|nr:DUF4382 domain-containing protein [Flavobacteriaceae bacterium AH-315-B10]